MAEDTGESHESAAGITTVRCTVPDKVARIIRSDRPTDNENENASVPLYLSIEAPAPGAAAGETNVAVEERPPPPRDGRLDQIAGLSQPERYDMHELIGRGGMATVRRVVDRVLNRETAMKEIEGPLSSKFLEVLRFLEEAQITGQLDHPSVVPVHDFGIGLANDRAYFTMKLVRGDTLGQIVSLHHAIGLDGRALERLLGIFLRVCEGISFAHSRHVVHRDLKPENILVGSHGQVYVMDWGLARVADGGRPSERASDEDEWMIAGTPSFMAPEQARGNLSEIDTRTDVFGLGAVLYAILTGRGPFASPTANSSLALSRAGEVAPPERVASRAIPPELSRITLKALAAKQADRYQTVDELAKDVQEFLRGGGWFATKIFAPGSVIVNEGDQASAAYVITRGRCEVFKTVEGTKMPLRVLSPGDVFGETAIFTGKPRTASVAALDEVTVKVVTRESLEHELDRSPWMGSFVRALAERFVDIDEKLSQRET